MEPDRFAEERRRGMTIDLGYAWTTVPSGLEVAFVDVPGHQRFIANMLAGIGPAPAVLFVVAADEGWRRQSSEHLAALDALDVRHGLLAVTRCDLADPAPALADARARLGRSSLGEVEAVAVSGVTGAGLGELRAALGRLVERLPPPDPQARIRLWLDRSFSIRGAGTVVTGTLSAATLRVGEELELHGRRVTVRALQTAGKAREQVTAPARVAVNLRGLAAGDVGRGDVLTTPGAWHWTQIVDVDLGTEDRLPAELVAHLGTASIPVRVRRLGAGIARLRTGRPVPVQVGDRLVLRDPGRHAVAAGAVVLDADPPALERRGAAAARAADLAAGAPDLRAEVARRGAVTRGHLARLGVDLSAVGELHISGKWLVDPAVWTGWVERAPAALDASAALDPLDPAPAAPALRRELGVPADPNLFGEVLAAARLDVVDGRVVRHGSAPRPDRLPAGVQELVARLETDPFAAPARDDLRALGLGHRELAASVRAGALLVLPDDIVLLPTAPAAATQLLRGLPQPFTTSEARQALGTTRRVVIPLLEHLDTTGVTEQLDDARRRLT